MQLYQSIFRQSWQITRTHKVLWVFGLFVLFWGGKGVDLELFFSDAKLLGSGFTPFRPEFWQAAYWQSAFATLGNNLFVSIGMGLLLLAFACFVLFVIMSSQIALIDAFAVYRTQNSSERYSFDHALNASGKHMIAVLSVNLLSKVFSYGLLGIASAPLFFAQFPTSKFVYTATLYLFIMPVVVFISILTKYAVNAVVIDQLPVMNAFKRGWNMLSHNVGTSLEFALLSFMVFVATNIASVFVAGLATTPALFIGMIIAMVMHLNFGLVIYFYIFYVLAVVIAFAASAVFSAWHFGNWTLLYVELTKGNQRSKIHRLLKGNTPKA